MIRSEKFLLGGIALALALKLVLPTAGGGGQSALSAEASQPPAAIFGCVPSVPCPAVLDAKYGWDPANFSRPHLPDGADGFDAGRLVGFGLSDTQLAFVYADTLVKRFREDIKPAGRNCNTRVRAEARRWERDHTWLIKSAERVLSKLGQLAPPQKTSPLPYSKWQAFCDRVAAMLTEQPDILPADGIERVAQAGRQAKPGMLTPALRQLSGLGGKPMNNSAAAPKLH